MKAPEIECWVDTVKQLIKNKWLVKVADLERGITVYEVTGLGLEAYDLVCYLIKEDKLYGGPECQITNPNTESKSVKKLYNDDLVVKQFDYQTRLTPKGAEMMAVMWFVHSKNISNVTKLQKALDDENNKVLEKKKPKDKKKLKVNKMAEISMKVIKGTNQVGKMMGDMSKAMDKMGTSMGGDFGGGTSKKKGKKKGNSYGDEYSNLGKKMMDSGKY